MTCQQHGKLISIKFARSHWLGKGISKNWRCVRACLLKFCGTIIVLTIWPQPTLQKILENKMRMKKSQQNGSKKFLEFITFKSLNPTEKRPCTFIKVIFYQQLKSKESRRLKAWILHGTLYCLNSMRQCLFMLRTNTLELTVDRRIINLRICVILRLKPARCSKRNKFVSYHWRMANTIKKSEVLAVVS